MDPICWFHDGSIFCWDALVSVQVWLTADVMFCCWLAWFDAAGVAWLLNPAASWWLAVDPGKGLFTAEFDDCPLKLFELLISAPPLPILFDEKPLLSLLACCGW